MRSKLAAFQELSKSGIVTLVVISVLAGYLIGQPSELPFDWKRFLLTLFGVMCLAAGSSALNQVQERMIDARMPRTRLRPLPSGRLTIEGALAFAFLLLVLGIIALTRLGDILAFQGIAAVFLYNGLYTLWWKKHWAHAAIPGALPGALPVLMGYTAAADHMLAPAGVYLFTVLFFWQMPHFWVLALRYKDDYEKGGIPTLPVAKGSALTVHEIVIWCLGYVGLMILAPLFLKVRAIYGVFSLIISGKVLWELRTFAAHPESKNWLRFFLWINLSLIAYLAAAVVDLWSVYVIRYLS